MRELELLCRSWCIPRRRQRLEVSGRCSTVAGHTVLPLKPCFRQEAKGMACTRHTAARHPPAVTCQIPGWGMSSSSGHSTTVWKSKGKVLTEISSPRTDTQQQRRHWPHALNLPIMNDGILHCMDQCFDIRVQATSKFDSFGWFPRSQSGMHFVVLAKLVLDEECGLPSWQKSRP
jgi:hypothetical protein